MEETSLKVTGSIKEDTDRLLRLHDAWHDLIQDAIVCSHTIKSLVKKARDDAEDDYRTYRADFTRYYTK